VVVRRNVEVGTLVASGSATTTRELFYLAQTGDLRVTVGVPQVYAGDVAAGKEVGIKLLERPNMLVKGQITRVAGGIDVATRSVQVEVIVPNKEGKLLPGAYVEVSLPLQGGAKALLVPANTLQFRQDGPRVAVVGEGGKVVLREVKLGRDLGRSVEITSGLAPKDSVILNPHDSIEEGERVIAKAAPEEKPEGKPPAGKGKAPEKAAAEATPTKAARQDGKA
jgi:multidrug efflux system membrane fusion protein